MKDTTRSGAGAIGVGAAACAACCAGPILGFLGGLGALGLASTLLFGLGGFVLAVVAASVVAARRRRRAAGCAKASEPVPVTFTARPSAASIEG